MALPERNPTQTDSAEKRSVGRGLFKKCAGCGHVLTAPEFAERFHICPACGHHHRMTVAEWKKLLLDDGAFETWDDHIVTADPLLFVDDKPYPERVARAQKQSGASEAIQVGRGKISGLAVALGFFDFSFMGGSMGSVVGERMTRMFERAADMGLPVVLLHASGGARMQEGILSLMQMAKSVAALARFRERRKPYISLLLDPTTGGVAASTAFLGDINLVEPNSQVGFAGARVIEATIRTTLPEGFQKSDFLLSHGMVDAIVPRMEMKKKLASLLLHLGVEAS
ncbi:MAG: acetyl-CoA carboxylase, carboxyltransferase subunit beta [Myxococcales bacterium]